MKVVAYNIREFEKQPLAKANQRKHDITLISNGLSLDTLHYAEGKQAVLICQNDYNSSIVDKLADLGIKYLLLFTESSKDNLSHHPRLGLEIFPYCKEKGIQKSELVQKMAHFTVQCLDNWQANITKPAF